MNIFYELVWKNLNIEVMIEMLFFLIKLWRKKITEYTKNLISPISVLRATWRGGWLPLRLSLKMFTYIKMMRKLINSRSPIINPITLSSPHQSGIKLKPSPSKTNHKKCQRLSMVLNPSKFGKRIRCFEQWWRKILPMWKTKKLLIGSSLT